MVNYKTRAPLALQISHYLLGGGGLNTPRLSRLLLVEEKNRKSVRKLVKNDYETISVKFSLSSKLWSQEGPKMPKISSFSRLLNIALKNLHYHQNYHS